MSALKTGARPPLRASLARTPEAWSLTESPLENANVYWVRTVEMKSGNLPKHSFKLMVGLDEPERLSGLERDAFTRAYFATLKFREGILTIGQDGEPTLQRNTSITLKAAGVLQKTYVITAIQFLGTLPEVPMLGPPLREYSLPTTPIPRLVEDPGIAKSVP